MQHSRFELKYHVNEETASRVRDFVRCYLDMDEFSVGKPDYSYPVHSLYLDSDSLELYWRTVNGDKNRYKLRVRYYSDHPDSPVFFEIKRRMKDIILKQRGGVRHEAVSDLLAGHMPASSEMLSKDASAAVALQRFISLMSTIQAKPKTHICYQREAYVSDDDQVRVTMDRQVLATPNHAGKIKVKMTDPVHAYRGIVILELKYTNRFPNWFRELVRMADVMQTGAAKYVSTVNLLGHRSLLAHDAVMEEESLLRPFSPGDDLPVHARERTPFPRW
jgi:hypothetical protein